MAVVRKCLRALLLPARKNSLSSTLIEDRQMIVEITFWIAIVATTRKLGKVYARSGDGLYGPYVSR
jgi:hypothetical protein